MMQPDMAMGKSLFSLLVQFRWGWHDDHNAT